jgi:hypothetical protein
VAVSVVSAAADGFDEHLGGVVAETDDDDSADPAKFKPLSAFLADMRAGYDLLNTAGLDAEMQQLSAAIRLCERLAKIWPPDHDGLPLEQFAEPLRRLHRDLDEFYAGMREAAASFDSQAKHGGRALAWKQIEAGVLFLRARDSGAVALLMHLENALRHLDDNVVADMLVPAKRAGAPPLTQLELQRRGVAAAAVDLLMRSGENVSLEAAAREVAEIHRRAGRPVSWTVVMQWREDAMQAPKDFPNTHAYRHVLDNAEAKLKTGEWSPAGLRKYAESLLLDKWP